MTRKIAILGAGIAGLSLAWSLKKRYGDHAEISIFEKSNRVGGWIQTIQKKGFLFELGPRSCRPKGAGVATLKLIEELGLQGEVLPGSRDARYRYLYKNNALRPFPTNPFSFLFSPLTRDLLPALIREWRCPKTQEGDETIDAFISRRLSPAIAQRLVDPMTSGIYAGDIAQLSMRSCFPKIWEWEQEHGSIIKGMFAKKPSEQHSSFIQKMQKHALFSFKDGMGTLPKELEKRLQKELHLNTEVTAIHFHEHHAELIINDDIFHADHVYSTIPSHALASLVPALSLSLQRIPFASVAVVNVGFRTPILKKKGFGYLIPSSEKEEILGVVWDSCVFPEQNRSAEETRLTVMMGGEHMPSNEEFSSQQLLSKALEALKRHLNIDQTPDATHIHIARNAIPQYILGHHQRVQELERYCPHSLTLLGNSYHGVSLNDAIQFSLELRSEVYK